MLILYDEYKKLKDVMDKNLKVKNINIIKNYLIFIYRINKVNYLVFSYEKEAPLDKFWLYYFDDKKEMLNFIKEQL